MTARPARSRRTPRRLERRRARRSISASASVERQPAEIGSCGTPAPRDMTTSSGSPSARSSPGRRGRADHLPWRAVLVGAVVVDVDVPVEVATGRAPRLVETDEVRHLVGRDAEQHPGEVAEPGERAEQDSPTSHGSQRRRFGCGEALDGGDRRRRAASVAAAGRRRPDVPFSAALAARLLRAPWPPSAGPSASFLRARRLGVTARLGGPRRRFGRRQPRRAWSAATSAIARRPARDGASAAGPLGSVRPPRAAAAASTGAARPAAGRGGGDGRSGAPARRGCCRLRRAAISIGLVGR